MTLGFLRVCWAALREQVAFRGNSKAPGSGARRPELRERGDYRVNGAGSEVAKRDWVVEARCWIS
jgi:hypothetical protein